MRSCFLVNLEILIIFIIFIIYLFIYILFIVASALFVPECIWCVDGAYCCGVMEAHFSELMLLFFCVVALGLSVFIDCGLRSSVTLNQNMAVRLII